MSKAKTLAGTVSTGGVLENPANVLVDSDIGVAVQAYDADLTSWAAIAPSAKQDTLVSGTNIKTVNGTSVLGSGDITISAGANPGIVRALAVNCILP
jgi:hypothetical protein